MTTHKKIEAPTRATVQNRGNTYSYCMVNVCSIETPCEVTPGVTPGIPVRFACVLSRFSLSLTCFGCLEIEDSSFNEPTLRNIPGISYVYSRGRRNQKQGVCKHREHMVLDPPWVLITT